MSYTVRRLSLALGLFSFFSFSNLHAEELLTFENAWAAEAPPVAPVMAGYMVIKNPTNKELAITGGHSPSFKTVEVHTMLMREGMMEMKKLDQLAIPAKGEVTLKPGGLHVMLIKPLKTHKAGDKIKVTFNFTNGKTQTIQLPVKKRDQAMKHDHHMHH